MNISKDNAVTENKKRNKLRSKSKYKIVMIKSSVQFFWQCTVYLILFMKVRQKYKQHNSSSVLYYSVGVHIKRINESINYNTKTLLNCSLQRLRARGIEHIWLSIWWQRTSHGRPWSTWLRFWNTVIGREFWQCNQCIWKTRRCHRSIGRRYTCLNINQ